ncbi:hypothetical protein CWC25_19675 [Pseudoalteromonas sp. S4389]|nr:hypothetical protein CWC25_19675 [Pseudoalteromonas sp. S4389]
MLLTYPFLSVANAKLKPFGSDGCSSFPDGTIEHKNLWLACCTAHDLAYWQGGTFKQREQADVDLKECVAKVGEKEIAVLMLAGVRVGGTPFLPTSFRWGYGWPYPKFYGELTEQERMQVESRLAELNTEKNN